MAVYKIVILFIFFQIVTTKSLFKEIHMKKDFEFSIKPLVLPFKPFTFIKQKLVHFGHGIVKRSPFELAPLPGKNVDSPDNLFKVSLDKEFGAGPPLLPPPPPPDGLPSMFIPEKAPEISSPAPVISVPPVSMSTLIVRDELSRLPLEGAEEVIVITPLPPVVSVPPDVPPPPPPNPEPVPGPPPPVPPEAPKVVQGNLLTDIARVDEINAYLKAVEALGTPPPPPALLTPAGGPPPPPPIENVLPVLSSNSIEVEVTTKPPPPPLFGDKLNTGPLAKGSRLALYFGNILLQVMSEVISSARSALSQYSPPAPI